MRDILNERVLVLNRHWSAINFIPLDRAVNRMNSAKNPYSAILIEYAEKGIDDEGNIQYDFDNPIDFRPVPWEEWIKLSPRPYDKVSMRTTSLNLRVPTTIITFSYDRPPKAHKLKPTNSNLLEVYGYKDYWTGKQLSKNRVTKDHVISQHHHREAGTTHLKDQWSNLAPTDRYINYLKGSMTPEEFMKKYPQYKPHYELRKTAPERVREFSLIKELVHPDWRNFLLHNK